MALRIPRQTTPQPAMLLVPVRGERLALSQKNRLISGQEECRPPSKLCDAYSTNSQSTFAFLLNKLKSQAVNSFIHNPNTAPPSSPRSPAPLNPSPSLN